MEEEIKLIVDDNPIPVLTTKEYIHYGLQELLTRRKLHNEAELSTEISVRPSRSDHKSDIVGNMLMKAKINNPDLSILFTSIDNEFSGTDIQKRLDKWTKK